MCKLLLKDNQDRRVNICGIDNGNYLEGKVLNNKLELSIYTL